MKPYLLSFVAILASAGMSQGALTFSLQFSSPVGGALNNIADEVNSTASGLSWGILVSETGTDFDTPFNDLALTVGVNTTDGSELSSGYRYFAGGLTSALPFGTDPGVGNIGTSGAIDATAYQPSLDTGDFFALIWFERGFSSGDALAEDTNYGLLTNAAFVVPSDAASNFPLGSNFNGADPLRAATLTVVPEPSISMLGSLAVLGLLLRRRRS